MLHINIKLRFIKIMGVIKKIMNVAKEDYFVVHLSIINPLLPVKMTPKEIEVLGTFMSLKGDIAEADRFGTTCKKIVKEKLALSDGGLGNYIKTLKEKGFIYYNENEKLSILEILQADEQNQGYMFKIIGE